VGCRWRLSIGNCDEIVQIVEAIHNSFRLLARGRHIVHHTGAIEWFMTSPRGGIERIFNLAMTEENATREVAQLVEEIRNQKAPDAVITTPIYTPANIGEILMRNGFRLLDESCWAYGMAMDLRTWHSGFTVPEEITVRRVYCQRDFATWVEIVNIALFEHELMQPDDFTHLMECNTLHLYLVNYAGEPAGVCWALFNGSGVDINYVATLPAYRRRGVATSAIITALREAQKMGMITATLAGEASAMPVYEKIGFRRFFPIPVYEYRCTGKSEK
jgi:GNAT superfamily N-acetyltransferase